MFYDFMDWLTDRPYRMFGTMGILIVFSLGFLIWVSAEDQKKWDAFSRTHDCKVIAKTAGNWGTGVGSNGKVTSVYISGTTTYRCNDGIDYTR